MPTATMISATTTRDVPDISRRHRGSMLFIPRIRCLRFAKPISVADMVELSFFPATFAVLADDDLFRREDAVVNIEEILR